MISFLPTRLLGKSATRIGLVSATLAALAFGLPGSVEAHVGVHESGFAPGFAHPMLGLDHILAMVAVGLWAAQLGGRARWIVPAAFVSVMALGAGIGAAGFTVPFVETGISVSIIFLGLLIAFAVRLPVAASAALVGLFALAHGHAHGAEMPVDVSGLTFALGFLLATALLHAAGVGMGILSQRELPAPALRFAGGAVALAGVAMLVLG